MNIIEALQDKNNRSRICDGDRWLLGDGDGGWIVLEQKPYQRRPKIVIETNDESVAIYNLLEGSGG